VAKNVQEISLEFWLDDILCSRAIFACLHLLQAMLFLPAYLNRNPLGRTSTGGTISFTLGPKMLST